MNDLSAPNAILASIAPHLRFERREGRLWIIAEFAENRYRPGYTESRGCVIRGDGIYPAFRYGCLGMGGTDAQCVAQLVHWIRDKPRYGLRHWRFLCEAKNERGLPIIGLGDDQTMRLLGESAYADPAKTCCVHCGAPEPADWWSYGVVGPSCDWDRCMTDERRKELRLLTNDRARVQ